VKRYFVSLVTLIFATVMFVIATHESTSAQKSKTSGKPPMMVSFDELKWTDLPERPGMKVSVLSGDPKTGPYTQIRRVPAGTDNPLHAHSSEITNVIISGVW
jgi:hypothetical protein